jgi:hypothetical protein
MTKPDRPAQGPAVDELAAISALLTGPPPAPEVVEAARRRLAQLSTGPAPVRRPGPARPTSWAARARRGPRWLAPAAAAAAVAGVVAASLLIARTVGDRPGRTAITGPAAFAQVPPFFVVISPSAPGPAVVSATATGAVLGYVTVPRPARVFSMVAAAGNGREFVLVASRGQVSGQPEGDGPTRFYLLRLSLSGRPGSLTPLPIATQTREVTGLALSRDGRQLAVSLDPPGSLRTGAAIMGYSLATGDERVWAWPGRALIGNNYLSQGEFAARSLSWTADGSRLLFQVLTGHGRSRTAQIRLLDTTGPGDLRSSSQRLPIPSNELGPYGRPAPVSIHEPLLITGDGTRAVAPTSRVLKRRPGHPDDPMLDETISEFPVRAGQPVRAVYRQKFTYDTDPAVFWVNQTGTAMIIYRPAARYTAGLGGALGVLTPDGFTPFPAAVQHLFPRYQPDW